ncbi:hypothetical protein GCM10012284_12360 [Mangrovihabitans endophyticus]|uniref:ChlI/MoxR AAA lid domain-containing protein n=1 Tax=Mangrovihabitans endophyticus TaxID=1751298 RepID=A0A8J3BYB9_9ACTN|nr:hypothetical protein GCM10012284_12360 [Mangrovihabitans endophyticus]
MAELQTAAAAVEADRRILTYIVDLLTATRQHPRITVGASPRAGLDLLAVAKAHALLEGRDYVLPDDVKTHAVSVLAHRLTLTPETWVRDISAAQLVTDILAETAVPGGPSTTSQPESRRQHGALRS